MSFRRMPSSLIAFEARKRKTSRLTRKSGRLWPYTLPEHGAGLFLFLFGVDEAA